MRKELFKEKLKKAMEVRKFTSQQLAIDVEVSEATISFYRSGRRNPNREHMSRICKVLEIEKNYFENDKISADDIFSYFIAREKEAKTVDWKEEKIEENICLIRQILYEYSSSELSILSQLLNLRLRKDKM